jgi:hypothetical protein
VGPAVPFPNGTTGAVQGPVRWPDVVAALQWNFPNGALYASGMVGQRFYDSGLPIAGVPITGGHDNVFVWGAALGARYDFGRVEIGGMGGIGEGIGNKYFDGGATGLTNGVLVITPTSNTTFSADYRSALVYGAIGYVQVKLTDTIRATGAFNWTMAEVASEVPGYFDACPTIACSKAALTGVTQYYWAAFGNLLWNPVPQVTLGAEYGYQFASKYNQPNVHVHRLQLAAIYRF